MEVESEVAVEAVDVPGSKHCSSFTMTTTSSYCAGKACSTHLRIFAFGLALRGFAEVMLIMLRASCSLTWSVAPKLLRKASSGQYSIRERRLCSR